MKTQQEKLMKAKKNQEKTRNGRSAKEHSPKSDKIEQRRMKSAQRAAEIIGGLPAYRSKTAATIFAALSIFGGTHASVVTQ